MKPPTSAESTFPLNRCNRLLCPAEVNTQGQQSGSSWARRRENNTNQMVLAYRMSHKFAQHVFRPVFQKVCQWATNCCHWRNIRSLWKNYISVRGRDQSSAQIAGYRFEATDKATHGRSVILLWSLLNTYIYYNEDYNDGNDVISCTWVFPFLCSLIFLPHHISEVNIVLVTPLHLFNSQRYKLFFRVTFFHAKHMMNGLNMMS